MGRDITVRFELFVELGCRHAVCFCTLVAVGPAALLCNFLPLVAQSQLVVDERRLIGPLQCSLQHIDRLIQSILKHIEGGNSQDHRELAQRRKFSELNGHRITSQSKTNKVK